MAIQFKTKYTFIFKGWDIGEDGNNPKRDYYLSLLLVALISLVAQTIRVLFIYYNDRDKSRAKETMLYCFDALFAVIGMCLLMTNNFGVILVLILVSTLVNALFLPLYQRVGFSDKEQSLYI